MEVLNEKQRVFLVWIFSSVFIAGLIVSTHSYLVLEKEVPEWALQLRPDEQEWIAQQYYEQKQQFRWFMISICGTGVFAVVLIYSVNEEKI